jgi:hypothetical protein
VVRHVWCAGQLFIVVRHVWCAGQLFIVVRHCGVLVSCLFLTIKIKK